MCNQENQIFYFLNSAAIEALIGSFSAFLLFLLSDKIRRRREYNNNHKKTILALQIDLDEQRRNIFDNIQIKKVFDSIKADAENDRINITPDRLKYIEYNEEIIFSLKIPKYGNDIRAYFMKLRKINSSIDKLNWLYETVVNNFLSGKMNLSHYKDIISICVNLFNPLVLELKSAEEEVTKMLAINRLLHPAPLDRATNILQIGV